MTTIMSFQLTAMDVRLLRVLITGAMAEVEAAVEPGAMILPAGIEDAMSLITHYEWGKDFLKRLDALCGVATNLQTTAD